MSKLVKTNVLIVGELRGLGVEIAKNIVLAGPKRVSIFDPALCLARDVGINVRTRLQAFGFAFLL